jgi:hypothetical protein
MVFCSFRLARPELPAGRITKPIFKRTFFGLIDRQQKATRNNTDDAVALNDADQAIAAQPWEFA